ncbi:MAG: WYL domain-containing protein [Archangiaceae bacterium]|nr:WYL domain-containing protein [Archangiaceae bacterium]
MVQTSARLLRLLSLLQQRRFWGGAELARELEVTGRSVRRDVERLRSLGYPVHATAGVGGGYQLGAGKELPPLPLDDDEAVAVAVGLRAAMTGPVAGLESASIRALGKLEKVLPKRLRKRLSALNEVSVRMAGGARLVSGEALGAIAEACRDQRGLSFGYGGLGREQTERAVEPYRLVHDNYRWYLLAFDLDRGEWRTFRVDRIEGVPRVRASFRARPLPAADVGQYVSGAIAGLKQKYRVRVTLHAPLEVARARTRGGPVQLTALDAQSCELTSHGDSLEWICFGIGFLGLDFTVHEPPELVAEVKRLAGRFARATR